MFRKGKSEQSVKKQMGCHASKFIDYICIRLYEEGCS